MGKDFKIKALRVRTLCEERGWTPDDLSRYGWIRFHTARSLFYGKTTDPTISTLIPVARALGVYVENLVIPLLDEDAHLLSGPNNCPPRTPVKQEKPFVIKHLRIKEYCEQRGWNADVLARASSVNFNTVRNILYGQTMDPTMSTIIRIAHALETYVEDLVVEDSAEDVLGGTEVPAQ